MKKLVNAKYDPCRLFNKGDIVRVHDWNGRKTLRDGHVGFVAENEKSNGEVELSIDGWRNGVFYHACHLELVTPVEELEPYYIEEKDIEFQVRMKYEDKDCLISVFRFKNIVEGYKQYYDMLPTMKQASEAAESECKRRNDEYRKEQNND